MFEFASQPRADLGARRSTTIRLQRCSRHWPSERRWPSPIRIEHEHTHDETAPCESALQELYLYLDGELTPEKRTVIKEHLDDCNPCFEAFDFEAELRIVISKHCREEVPDSLRERVARAAPGLRRALGRRLAVTDAPDIVRGR